MKSNHRTSVIALEHYFRLRDQLSHPPSTMGGMVARLRIFGSVARGSSDGCIDVRDDSGIARTYYTADSANVEFAEAAVFVKPLTPDELEACELRYWRPICHETYRRVADESEVEPREVGEVPAPRSQIIGEPARGVPLLPVLMTADGEEQVGEVVEEIGGQEVHRRVVTGRRVTWTPFAEVAERMSLSVHQVRRLLGSARKKIWGEIMKRMESE